jgi:hypothetical protein
MLVRGLVLLLRAVFAVVLVAIGLAAGFFVGGQIGTGFEPERNMKIGALVGGLSGLMAGLSCAGVFRRRSRA